MVLGFRIYVDDGSNGLFVKRYDLTEPFTTAYDIDMDIPSAVIGATYRVKVGAYNRVGEVISDSVAAVLASVPSTPTPPTSVSDGSYLDIIMSIPASNGGSPITSYQLQIKYQPSDDWITELGATQDNIHLVFRVSRTIPQGQRVEARYRARNENGWSSYSNSAYLQMVGPPEMPERPTYLSSTGTTITVAITPVSDNNGAFVTKYYLFRDAGDYASEVNIPVSNYDGVELTYTVTGLTPGLKYRFTLQAENYAGKSPVSYETIIVAAELPSKPTFI